MIELFKFISVGLVLLLPMANPLTAVALFLGLAGEMNFKERSRQAMQASIYVFLIMMVAWYAGNMVMNAFGISIPGLRIAGGLIVVMIGISMLFPEKRTGSSPEVKHKQNEINSAGAGADPVSLAFVPLALPGTAGPGTIAIIISSASTVKAGVDFPGWVVALAPMLTFLIVAMILWISLRSSGAIMKFIGKGGIEAISRLMGFLLVCMGVQFVINGVLEVVRNFH